jgi:DNA (cytosine-5)-methyltransferase 1
MRFNQPNIPNIPNLGDITKINSDILEPLGQIDMITGGWPCRGNSYQGLRNGLANIETKLFYEIIRLVKMIKPKYVFLENVKGLLTVKGGDDFGIVKQELRDAGYGVDYELFNSIFYGTRQARERVFILATREENQQVRLNRNLHDYEEPKEIKNKEIIAVSKSTRDFHHDARIRDDGFVNTLTRGWGCRGQSTCNYVVEDGNIRFLTPNECELLMTLPEDYTKYGRKENGDIYEISDINRYKALGDAIVSNIPPHILKDII